MTMDNMILEAAASIFGTRKVAFTFEPASKDTWADIMRPSDGQGPGYSLLAVPSDWQSRIGDRGIAVIDDCFCLDAVPVLMEATRTCDGVTTVLDGHQIKTYKVRLVDGHREVTDCYASTASLDGEPQYVATGTKPRGSIRAVHSRLVRACWLEVLSASSVSSAVASVAMASQGGLAMRQYLGKTMQGWYDALLRPSGMADLREPAFFHWRLTQAESGCFGFVSPVDVPEANGAASDVADTEGLDQLLLDLPGGTEDDDGIDDDDVFGWVDDSIDDLDLIISDD